MSDWQASYEARERLAAFLKELAPTWIFTGGGVGDGGFDLSYDLPDNVSLIIEGGAVGEELAVAAYLTNDHDCVETAVPPEADALLSSFEALWKNGVAS